MKTFVLPRTRKGAAFRVDRTLPTNGAAWEPYHFRGTVRKKRENDDDYVRYKVFEGDGEQINWAGHVSPDMVPNVAQLHPTTRQIYNVMLHRAYANMMTDIKITNEELAAIVGRSKRMVAYHLAELTKLGFIGICHVKFGVGKDSSTWRMIRVHVAGFLMRWDTWESPTWFMTDYRPDSQRAPGKPKEIYNVRVAMSGRLPSAWGLTNPSWVWDRNKQTSVYTLPKIDPDLGPLFTGLRMGFITNEWFATHERLLDDHDYQEPYAVQVIGRVRMQKDLNDPQLVR